jgi:type III pantothenate kinase
VILVFDVGNTETTIGLFDGARLEAHWRTNTDASRTPDECAMMLDGLLRFRDVKLRSITGSAIGSVVPAVTGPLADACRALFGTAPRIVDASSGLPIVLDVEEPATVGADRLINTLAASRLYKTDTIVVDLGTATTYDCITAEGVFLGGIIAPGLRTSADTLIRRTSKLPATELVPPKRALGRRTEECIRAGVMLGTAEMIDGLVRRLKKEWPGGRVPKVVATGGLAEVIAPLSEQIELVEPFLTLYGLQIAHALLEGGKRA